MSVHDHSVEVLLVGWLQARLDARGVVAQVSTRRDTNSPAELVRIMRAGGTVRNYVEDWPIVIFECWGGDDGTAEAIGRATREEVQSLDNTAVGAAWLTWMDEAGGLTYFPHPDTALPRYQHTQQLKLNG